MAIQQPPKAFKARRIRPSVFTEDEFNQSESDKRSFYSEANFNPERKAYNFEQKQEEYLEEDDSVPMKIGRQSLIVRPRGSAHPAHLSPLSKTSGMAYMHSDQQLTVRKQPFDIIPLEKPMMGSYRSGMDYQTLYKQIKLTPMLEQPEAESNTIEPVDAKSLSMHAPWSHATENTSQMSVLARSEQIPPNQQPKQTATIQQIKRVGRITNGDRVFMPRITVSESPQKKMVDEQLQTSFQQDVEESSCDDTNFLKGIRNEIKSSQPTKSNGETQSSTQAFENVIVHNHLNYMKPRGLQHRQPPEPIDSRGDQEDQQLELQIPNSHDLEPSKDPQLQPQHEPMTAKIEYTQAFDLPLYLQLYYSLRSIQNNLRSGNLLKSLKSYLQVIASGRIDNIDYLRVSLHKKKTIRQSMLYERVAVVVLAFSFAADQIGQCGRYLSNLMRYVLHNYLTSLKILTHEQNNQHYPQLSRQQREVWSLSNKQSLNKCFEQMKDNNQILLETIFKLSKHDSLFYENLRKLIKNSAKFTIQQTFYFVLEYFAFFLHLCELEGKIPFLAVSPNPYLTQQETQRYTLVIDVLQIMCNSKKAELFRPYSQYFLDELAQHYEIVAFSAVFPNQMAKIIDHLDRKKRIEHRLFRHHTIKSHGHYVKDVARLGRDLSRVILLESGEPSAPSQANTISVKHWSGNSRDTVLAELCPILAMIAMRRMDARQAVAKYKTQLESNERSGVKYLNYGMSLV